ncbi:MAG TPA: VWA domain-containing protein [Candidatus Sulfotelmatobacter sp.]|nr:VWA domain-containing protein [Candidatus Sulfotelmatobacter sp.]
MHQPCCIGLVVFWAVMAASPQPQNAAPDAQSIPTFKAKARLVLLDVVVTTNKGEPVTGLKKEDFEVLEDGKPQSVSTFEEHKGAPATQIKLPPMPPNVYTNFPIVQSADSVNVILLDALNTPLADQVYVHKQMIKYLKTIPPSTRVAIFTLASRLRMLQGITTDSSLLLAAINNPRAGPTPSALRASTVESDADQSRIDFLANEAQGPASPNQTMAQAAVDPVNTTRQFLNDTALFETESRMSMTLEAMQQLARYLADIPGRKNVIWLSGSFPAGIVPDSDLTDPFSGAASFQEEIRKTTNLLTTAQISLYPIAAEGLTSDVGFQANNREMTERRGNLSMQDTLQESRRASIDLDASHASMEQLARDTGGQAIYNTNGLNDALTRVVNNGSRYYSLAYSPTNPNMDGKYRHIQVKLVRRKETITYRHGYYAEETQTDSAKKNNLDPLMQLMGRNLPDYTQIVYKVLVQPTNPQPAPGAARAGNNADLKGPITRLGVDFAVSVDDLRTDPGPDGSRHGNIEVMIVAYDLQGEPQNLVVGRSELRIPAKDYVNVQRAGLQIHKEIDVPKADVFLRTGIYDLNSKSAGTLGVPLRSVAASRVH